MVYIIGDKWESWIYREREVCGAHIGSSANATWEKREFHQDSQREETVEEPSLTAVIWTDHQIIISNFEKFEDEKTSCMIAIL